MKYGFSWGYALLQSYVSVIFRLHFRKLHYFGRENIPNDKPIIYAPTHRNALVDALVLVNDNRKRQVVFLARADIFKPGLLSRIFGFMRIMPVYRIRDGKENLSKNKEIFEQSGEVLKQGSPLCLFPEAIHNPKQNLLALKKGIPRIVLPTEAVFNFELDTQIIPVAFYYTNKNRFLSDLCVTYGEAIAVKNYQSLYAENENFAINQLRKDMESKLRHYVVDVPNEDYDEHLAMVEANQFEVLDKVDDTAINLPEAAQRVLQYMQKLKNDSIELYVDKIRMINEAIELLRKNKLTPTDLKYKIKRENQYSLYLILLSIASPFALLGLINLYLPTLIYKKLLKVIKDEQFISSIRIGSGVLILPIFLLLQSVVVWIIFGLTAALIYLFVSPMLFYFASYWRRWWKDVQTIKRLIDFKKTTSWGFVVKAFEMN